ncbi:hypothetical protein BGZ97_001911 [Linnemannia gamsii]|uniref:Uncharacterized protein n=1 Tax=Linnemannia gamsii TaxID=64522 RepID=A0A9P6R0F7_9FUNG|nr:hypothetical protein BGZ97_001911 [Linnemannia gamsii]
MDSNASMPLLPEDNCASQYNVGTLDAVGVAIVWFTVLRWIVLIIFADDLNILLCLPNPKRRGTGKPAISIQFVLVAMSPIYTIVQAFNCHDNLLKLNATTMVFLIIYELIFCGAKNLLIFESLGHVCNFTFPDIIVIAAGVVAIISEGGSWRALGILVIVLFCLTTLAGSWCSVTVTYSRDSTSLVTGPDALKYTILYPVILAVYVTLLAVKGHGGQWIPKPSAVVEYVMLVTRTFAGFGGIDLVGAIGSKVYRLIVPEVEECPDVEPGFSWCTLRIDRDSFDKENRDDDIHLGSHF